MINYFGGPEGGGKTALMTRYCRMHHLQKGEIWAFPGYEHKNLPGRVVSNLVLPEQVMGKVDDLTYIVLVIDEITNFMNHHNWQNKIIDILVYGALAQRRKRQFVVLATGPFFQQLPPDLRSMFHISFNCKDMHWANHKIPRGEKIQFTETDLRGVLSGRPYTTTKPRVFRPRDYFRFYDTFSLVDPKYQNLKLKIRKDEVEVDSVGNIIEKRIVETDPEVLAGYINGYEPRTAQYIEPVKRLIREIVVGGVTRIPRDKIWEYFKVTTNKSEKDLIGGILRSFGAKPIDRDKSYDFSRVDVEQVCMEVS